LQEGSKKVQFNKEGKKQEHVDETEEDKRRRKE
jgi:hypothetical protein